MEQKKVIAGAIIGVAILLPLGKWVIASRQDAADQKEAQKVEQQFRAKQAEATGAPPPAPGGGQWGRGGGQQGGRRRGGAGGGAQFAQRRQEMQQQMIKEVGLNPTQVKQLDAVRQSSRSMMPNVFRNPKLSWEQKRAAMQQMRQAEQQSISKFLSAEQMTKYTAFQEKMRAQMRAQWGGGRGGPGGGGWGGPGGPGGPGGGGPGGGWGGPGGGGPRGGGE